MSKRILLTGAAGFTGVHFARSAEESGHTVISLESRLTDAEDLVQELATVEFDYVVHLAAISAVTHSDLQAFYSVNLFGTLNLLSAISKGVAQPGKIIIASSANIYGNSLHSPIAEDERPSPVNHYAMSKLAMEHMASAQFSELPLVVARPFNYTGLGHDGRFVVPKIVDHFKERSPTIELGNMDVEREFNDVRTVCQIYLKLLEHGVAGETYNICSGRTYSLGTVLSTLSGITGHDIEARVNPDFVRAQEVHTLSGSATKLESCVGDVTHRPLKDTLEWMLGES